MSAAVHDQHLADRLGVPFLESIVDSRVDTALLMRLPLPFARRNVLLPLYCNEGTLLVASGDPAGFLALDEL
ncbi:type II secretion system protein GspE, partial [bacterium]